MHNNVNLLKLGFLLSLLAAFVLFAMPNLLDRSTHSEEDTIRAVSAHDAANSVKATKRIVYPAKLLLSAALVAAFIACRFELTRPPYRVPLVKAFFLAVISLRIRAIMLRPLKYTSEFV